MDPSNPPKKSEFPPLLQHVVRFTDEHWRYNSRTVAGGLQQLHGRLTWVKGPVIAGFNATHSGKGVCPKMSGQFVGGDDGTFGHHLHLGTTRIWKADGSIDEERWKKFADFVTMGQTGDKKYVFKCSVKAYLNYRLQVDKHELHTGRHASGWGSSEAVQATAATAAWDEVYERLTEGWGSTGKHEQEPYITLDLIRLFFEDSQKAFQAAEDQALPVAKPNEQVERARAVL